MASGIRKLDDDEWLREQIAISKRMNREHLAKHDRSFYGHLAKLADERNPVTEETRSAIAPPSHRASQIADLLVEAGSHPDRSAALDYLMHSSRGAALLSRMHKAAETGKETTMTTSHSEFARDVVKQYGVIALAKSMIRDEKSYGLDEPQFTQLATEHAQRIYPNDRPDVAFSKLYQGEESVRRACQIAKAMPFVADLTPVMVGGEDTRDLSDTSKAIEQLKQLGRDRWPTASESQQFERALTDPVNHKLARRAVPIPQATTSFPWPR